MTEPFVLEDDLFAELPMNSRAPTRLCLEMWLKECTGFEYIDIVSTFGERRWEAFVSKAVPGRGTVIVGQLYTNPVNHDEIVDMIRKWVGWRYAGSNPLIQAALEEVEPPIPTLIQPCLSITPNRREASGRSIVLVPLDTPELYEALERAEAWRLGGWVLARGEDAAKKLRSAGVPIVEMNGYFRAQIADSAESAQNAIRGKDVWVIAPIHHLLTAKEVRQRLAKKDVRVDTAGNVHIRGFLDENLLTHLSSLLE